MCDESKNENIKNLEAEVVELAQQLKKKFNIYFDGKKLLTNALAGDIVFDNFDSVTFKGNNRGYIVMNDKSQEIYRYSEKDGYYLDDGETKIRAIAQMVMGDKYTNFYVNEVIHAIKNFVALRVDRDTFNSYINLVNMKNGVFDTENKKLLPHSSKYYFTTKLDIDYNQDAKAPNNMKFFKDILKPEDIPIMQELFGYCLFPSYRYHKIFFFLGSGRNGKGTTLNLMKAFLGESNTTATSIDNLITQQNMTAELFGKTANICGEIGAATIEDSHILKMLSGEDLITAHRKYGQPFQFLNHAKLIFAMNEAPEIKDRTNGMWDRLIYLDFPNEFLDKAPGTDPDIKEKLITPDELSGLFNWAVDGLERLKKQGGFSYNKTVDENMRQYDLKANTVLAFAQEHLEEEEGSYIFKEVLQTRIKQYCIQNKVKIIGAAQLTKKLTDVLTMCYPTRLRIDEERRYVYMNIKFKDEDSVKEEKIVEHSSPQKKLMVSEALSDKINNLILCFEMHDNEMDWERLLDEGFDKEFLLQCIERKIIIKKPNGLFTVGG